MRPVGHPFRLTPAQGVALLLLGAAGIALRLSALAPAIGDVDGVNFARAVERFDPLHQSPHFPGYPVYVAVSQAAKALGAPLIVSLTAPGIVLWPIALVLLFLGVHRQLGAGAALGAGVVASLAPGAIVVSGWPGSDGLGFSLLGAALGALGLALPAAGDDRARRRWLATTGVLLGLVLGVRLSWWPLVLSAIAAALLLARRDAVRVLLPALSLAVLAWMVPLLHATGEPSAAIELARGFVSGHFTTWGNTALVASAPLGDRFARAAYALTNAGLGTAWPASIPLSSGGSPDPSTGAFVLLAGLALAAGLAIARARGTLQIVLGFGAPYLLWVLIGQNVEKPRHFIALLPLAGAAIGAGLAVLPKKALVPAAAALTLALCSVSVLRARAQHDALAPAAAIVAAVVRDNPPSGVAIFAGEEARLFEHFAPAHRVMRPKSDAILEVEAARLDALGVKVLITSGALKTDAAGPSRGRLERIAEFAALEGVRGHDAHLALYRYRGDLSGPRTEARR
ncbi:MAG: hypothetical protein IT384_34905 [Deltaproteobacteria bacterium]|nr:hypothetical protein [Deltaproteobacteria bacterium]